jgi:endonuclease YncB( thermonuclease family)
MAGRRVRFPPQRRRRRPPVPRLLVAILALGILGLGGTEAWRPAAESVYGRLTTRSHWSATTAGEPARGEVTGRAGVRDGDTIVVSGVPVRLRGLHCPELGTAAGDRARQEMARLIGGSPVSCVLTGERTYDRHVGWCAVHGRDLGAELIRGGV